MFEDNYPGIISEPLMPFNCYNRWHKNCVTLIDEMVNFIDGTVIVFFVKSLFLYSIN
jgi:hypothetical protein